MLNKCFLRKMMVGGLQIHFLNNFVFILMHALKKHNSLIKSVISDFIA